MKKNIIIVILIFIIIILLIKIMNPSVVTQRKTTGLNNNVISETIDDVNLPEKVEDKNEKVSDVSPLVPEFHIEDDSQNTRSLFPQPMETKPLSEHDSAQQISNADGSKNSMYKITLQHSFNSEDCDICSSKLSNSNGKKYNPLRRYDVGQNNYKSEVSENSTPLENGLDKNLSMCNPYKETSSSEYLGMNIQYNIEILGWQNGKCILNFESNIAGIGSSFEDMYGVPANSAQVFGFAPKIRCEFTKQQLLYVGDNILEENSKNRKMLKDPNQINFPDLNNLSFNDIKLLHVIFNDKACHVVNANDISKMFEGLLEF